MGQVQVVIITSLECTTDTSTCLGHPKELLPCFSINLWLCLQLWEGRLCPMGWKAAQPLQAWRCSALIRHGKSPIDKVRWSICLFNVVIFHSKLWNYQRDPEAMWHGNLPPSRPALRKACLSTRLWCRRQTPSVPCLRHDRNRIKSPPRRQIHQGLELPTGDPWWSTSWFFN